MLTDVIYSGPFYTAPKPRTEKSAATHMAPPEGTQLKTGNGRVELTGTGVDATFIVDLKAKAWISQRMGG